MLPSDFPQSNINLNKPEEMTDEECMSIRAFFNGQLFLTYWKPNKEDIDAINEGKGVWVSVTSNFHPPIDLTTENPFEETKDE